MFDFRERVAIVSGATRGIGRAIALELARAGATVVFNYARSSELAEGLVKEIEAGGGKAVAFGVNVADFEGLKVVVKDVKERFGRVDCLVNNAGITKDKLLLMMGKDDWDQVIETNLTGTFNLTRHVLGLMVRARYGRVLNITSVSGVAGIPGQANYSASKAGIIGFTKAIAKEVGSRGITVNALSLGFIETDLTRGLEEKYRERILEMIALRRFASPEEVAKVAAFLLSDAAAYITGQVIGMDGGLSI